MPVALRGRGCHVTPASKPNTRSPYSPAKTISSASPNKLSSHPSPLAIMETFLLTHPYLAAICVVVPTIVLTLSQSSKLDHIPSFGHSTWLGSYISAFKYVGSAPQILQGGYHKYRTTPFKAASLSRWIVVIGRHHLEDIRKSPDDELSLTEAANETAMLDHLIGQAITSNPYHISVVRRHLTRNISRYYPEIVDELFTALNEILDVKDNEWMSIPAAASMREIICRTSSRVFVGLPLCRNADWIDLNSKFAVDVIKDANFLNIFPKVLRPFMAQFVPNTAKAIKQGMKHLGPIISERLKCMDEYGKEWSNKPNDFLQHLMDEGEESTTKQLTVRMLTMGFVSIHATANTFTQALYNLAANPQYVQPLREEVEAAIEKYGWTKEGITAMHRVDSFLTESQRLGGVLTSSIQRKAMKNLVLSDGTFIPKGTRVVVPTRAIHHDHSLYENAYEFNPFRFSNLEDGEGENSRVQFTSVTQDYLPFGFGKHACPGRFLAASELKMMLAYIVSSYDVKLEDDSSPPGNVYWDLNIVADPVARIMFRKRTDN